MSYAVPPNHGELVLSYNVSTPMKPRRPNAEFRFFATFGDRSNYCTARFSRRPNFEANPQGRRSAAALTEILAPILGTNKVPHPALVLRHSGKVQPTIQFELP